MATVVWAGSMTAEPAKAKRSVWLLLPVAA
jgi:hypothetical protein